MESIIVISRRFQLVCALAMLAVAATGQAQMPIPAEAQTSIAYKENFA